MLARLGIGPKLALAFSALAAVTVIVVVLALLAGQTVTRDIDLAEGERLPGSITSERAQASLLRMQLHVRGYLVLGNKQDIEDYQEQKLLFEHDLSKLRALARNWPPEDAYLVSELVADYGQWIHLPQKLFELHDDPLTNRPASRLVRFEVQPRRQDVLSRLEAMIASQNALRASTADTGLLADLIGFQTSFDAMVTNLMAFAVSGDPNFQSAYDRHLAATAALWQRLSTRRDLLDDAQRKNLYLIQQRRTEIGEVALQIINVMSGDRPFEDLYLYRTQAEPLAQSMVRVFGTLTARQQARMQGDLGRARERLWQAGLPATVGGLLAIGLAVLLAYISQRSIAQPMRHLAEVAEQVATGTGSASTEAHASDEITRLSQTLNTRLRKEELQHLMASISDAVWSAVLSGDGSLVYRYLSPVIERIAGRPPEHFLGSAQHWLDGVHPADQTAVAECLARIASGTSDREDAEYRIIRPDGEVRWVRDRLHATRAADGRILLYGVVGDITDRKLAEEALRESEARFRAFVDFAPDAFMVLGEDGTVLDVNRQACESLGYSREELIGMTARDFDQELEAAALQGIRERLAAGELVTFETRHLRKDGTVFPVEVRGRRRQFRRADRNCSVALARDITERKRAEAERVKLEERLRQAEKMQAIGTLAGGIAHDFNNILGAILGYGELAQRKAGKSGPLREHLDQVMQAGNRGKRLVEHILAFSRSGVGERIPVHVQSVVEEALNLLAASLPPTIRLAKVLRGGDAAVAGDATQLHQVTMNLCTNAVQAMPKGGVLSVTLERADIDEARKLAHGTLAPGPYVRLQVTDTGTGIAPAVLERIFDPFFTTKGVGEGTGLGLSLVYGIVADFGGAVDVETREGAGTAFTVWLPSCGEAPARVVDAAGVLPHGNGEAVLIVDDERPLVNVAAEMLAGLGYEPVGFSSSADALAAFRAEPERFDLVLTDQTMPDMTGIELAREMRRLRADIPIVLMSGYSGPQLTEQARAAGVSDILRKPLVSRDIAEALARVIPARA